MGPVAREAVKTAPDQCLICRRRTPRGLEPRLVDSEGREASIHTSHHFDTIFRAGFSISVLGKDEPTTPGSWTFK